MDTQSILIACAIGIIAGWLASMLLKGGGSGLVLDLVIGVLGSFVGAWLIPKTGISLPAGYPGAILTAFIGAVVLLLAIRIVSK